MRARIGKIIGIVLIIGLFALIPLFMGIKQEEPCLTCKTHTAIKEPEKPEKVKTRCLNLGFYITCSSDE